MSSLKLKLFSDPSVSVSGRNQRPVPSGERAKGRSSTRTASIRATLPTE
ncbi:MAG: hypothetical protein P8I97_13610 [Verrucomicrobiales bacterium]|nr:hypothetical protein [Verrucomicrobiales bacterium]